LTDQLELYKLIAENFLEYLKEELLDCLSEWTSLEIWLGLTLTLLVVVQGVTRFRKLGRSLKRRGKARSFWTMVFNLFRKSKQQLTMEEGAKFAAGLNRAGQEALTSIPERSWTEGQIVARLDAWSNDRGLTQNSKEGSKDRIFNIERGAFEIPTEAAGRF
jgi:hypothetical protein